MIEDLSRSQLESLIDEWIVGKNGERNRAILKRRLIDGITYEKIAEESIKVKARGNAPWASRFKEMASQELQHAQYLHEYIVQEITNIKTVYNPTEHEIEKWDKCDRKFYEKEAMLKVMLSM